MKLGPMESKALKVMAAAEVGHVPGLTSAEVARVLNDCWGAKITTVGAGVTLSKLARKGFVRVKRVYNSSPTVVLPDGPRYGYTAFWRLDSHNPKVREWVTREPSEFRP